MYPVLLLNADFSPIKVITWERAIGLVLEETVDLLETYVGKVLHSAHAAWPFPSVVRLKKYIKTRTKVRFNRSNVMARDGYKCQYCGIKPVRPNGKPDLDELSLEHIVPRSKSINSFVKTEDGRVVPVTSWVNVVTACHFCNMKKSDRTPAQAGMRLLSQPRVPTTADILRMSLIKLDIPSEWMSYLPEDSGWRGYWTDELDKD